jgi:uncharacterized membrane protein YdjX (TVP38/TMEM64 family)
VSRNEVSHRRLGRVGAIVVLLGLALVVLALAPAHAHAFDLRERLTALALGAAQHPWGVVVAILGYAMAGVLFVPVNLLAAVCLAVFGGWPGMGVAWLGGLLGAVLSHTLGWHLGARALLWVPERTRQRWLTLSHGRALWVTVLMRVLPVGNFGAFNLLAGAGKLPRRAFVMGNMVGLVPSLLGLGVIANRLMAVLHRPGVENFLYLGLALALASAGVLFLRRRYRTGIEISRESLAGQEGDELPQLIDPVWKNPS